MALPPTWRWKLDRWKETLRGLFTSPKEEGRPRLCPACGRLVGANATKCHECGADLRFSLAAASRSLSSWMPASSPVSYFILGINFFFFAICLAATLQAGGGFSLLGSVRGDVLLRLGARQAYFIFQGELWRLVMPIFLHGSLLHLGMNCFILMDIGRQVEELYGSSRYLFLYIFTGIASFIVSTAWSIYAYGGLGVGVGASGALMGLIGVMLAMTSRSRGAMMQMYRSQLVRWLVYIFVFGLLMPGIDNAAHAGGLAAGYLLGRVMADREPQSAAERKRAYALGWLAGMIAVVSFAAMLVSYLRSA